MSFLRCSWNNVGGAGSRVDVCMFGGTCSPTTETCTCPPGTMKDNFFFHLEGCAPQVLLDNYWLDVAIFFVFGCRMLQILTTRKMKKFLWNAAFCALVV